FLLVNFFAFAQRDRAAQRRRELKQRLAKIRRESPREHAQDPDVRKLQYLGGVHCHQADGIGGLFFRANLFVVGIKQHTAAAFLEEIEIIEKRYERLRRHERLAFPNGNEPRQRLDGGIARRKSELPHQVSQRAGGGEFLSRHELARRVDGLQNALAGFHVAENVAEDLV